VLVEATDKLTLSPTFRLTANAIVKTFLGAYLLTEFPASLKGTLTSFTLKKPSTIATS
jgi:hypothetical protein